MAKIEANCGSTLSPFVVHCISNLIFVVNLSQMTAFGDFGSAVFEMFFKNTHNFLTLLLFYIFVPTPLEGGGTIYSNGFLLFRQF